MMGQKKFTDGLLTAYLDGEVDAETSREIVIALETDPALQARFEGLSMPVRDLKQVFDRLLVAAPASPDLPWKKGPFAPFGKRAVLGNIAASLIVGFGLGMVLTASQIKPQGWKGYAAAYHALYVNGTLSTVDMTIDDQMLLLKSLSDTLGHDLSAAQNDQILRFKRGQLLGYTGNPLIQLAYLTPLGNPVALCITRASNNRETAINTLTLEGMAAAEWSRDGLEFLLIGSSDPVLIEAAANRFAATL